MFRQSNPNEVLEHEFARTQTKLFPFSFTSRKISRLFSEVDENYLRALQIQRAPLTKGLGAAMRIQFPQHALTTQP